MRGLPLLALLGLVATLAALVAAASASPPAFGAPGSTERVSVGFGGVEAIGGNSLDPAISGTGRVVAFWSDATNLVGGDSNRASDVFIHPRGGQTQRVSVDSDRGQADGPSFSPSISVDARYVAFDSAATNLVDDDFNNRLDVFVRDRITETTERVSVPTGGGEFFADARLPSMSDDGRFVAFQLGTNRHDIYLHDRQARTTELVSVSSAGEAANGDSSFPAISGDGDVIAFMSAATNLVPSDTNGGYDVFVHDRVTETTDRVSVPTGGRQVGGEGFPFAGPAISDSGRFVTFFSRAPDLVAGDTNAFADVFVRDRLTGVTERVSVATGGAQATGESFAPSISDDGRFVAFNSNAADLVAGDGNFTSDVFVHDRRTRETVRVSVATGGGETVFGQSGFASISDLGGVVAFQSFAPNLVAGDTNGNADVFVNEPLFGAPPRPAPPAGFDPPSGAPSPRTEERPSNRFSFIGKARKLNGRTVLRLSVPGPGEVAAAQARVRRGKAARVKRATATAGRAGPVELTIRPSKKGRRLLRRKRRFEVRLRVTFTPEGGALRSTTRRVPLLRKTRT